MTRQTGVTRRHGALPRDLAANQRRPAGLVTRRAAQRAERAALDNRAGAATHQLVPVATHHQQPDPSQKLDTGHIPFDPHAANLMFALVSSRYERASTIVTSNKPFSRWGEIFGDDVVAAAMIDRLVHHAEILNLKGDSYRLKDKDLGSPLPAKSAEIG